MSIYAELYADNKWEIDRILRERGYINKSNQMHTKSLEQAGRDIYKFIQGKGISIAKMDGFMDVMIFLATMYAHVGDYVGIYIIRNTTKDMYYVGQGKRVLQRVRNHFT